MEALVASQVLLWVGLIALALFNLVLLRQIGVLYERIAPAGALSMNAELKVGDKAPTFTETALGGNPVIIGGVAASGQNTLLFFLSTNCPVCKELVPTLKSLARTEGATTRTVLVGSGEEQGHEAYAETLGWPVDGYIVSDQLGMAFAVSKLPYAVLIDGQGVVASFGLVNNREHLESLFEAQRSNVASIQEYSRKPA